MDFIFMLFLNGTDSRIQRYWTQYSNFYIIAAVLHKFGLARVISQVHISLKTVFALGTQPEKNGINNANPILAYPTRIIFHWLALGPPAFALGLWGLVLGQGGFALGPRGFVLGL